MAIDVRAVRAEDLPLYAAIPIRFAVRSVLRVREVACGLGGLRLAEVAVANPWVKDYDAQGDVPGGPLGWPARFDLDRWGLLLAWDDGWPIGGAAVIHDAPEAQMLDGRSDLAVLWDLRVHPDLRRRGVGKALFAGAATWARARGCRQLKVETQNVNVPACRFYAQQGCQLGAIHRYAYADQPGVAEEVMLLWYKDLRGLPAHVLNASERP